MLNTRPKSCFFDVIAFIKQFFTDFISSLYSFKKRNLHSGRSYQYIYIYIYIYNEIYIYIYIYIYNEILNTRPKSFFFDGITFIKQVFADFI